MYTDTLPPVLARKFGNLNHIRKRGRNEYSAECPVCRDAGHIGNDEPDRFRMFDDDKPLGWCRRCGHVEFADGDSYRPTPEEIAEANERRARLAEQEARRMQSKIERLRSESYWQAWNESMDERARQLWRDAGIPDSLQNYWELGYRADYHGQGFTSPAMTIPYFAPGRQAVTVQYRLLQPPKPSDKYRFESGLKSDLWLADPEEKPAGATLLVEGMKKAGVCFAELVGRAGHKLSVVGAPSKSPGAHMLDRLEDCEPVYVALDPDAYTGKNPEAGRLGDMLGDRARFVRLPAKPDDLFTDYGFTPDLFMSYVKQATKAVA